MKKKNKHSIKSDNALIMEKEFGKYLKEKHSNNEEVPIQEEMGKELTKLSEKILGKKFRFTQDRVSDYMNDQGYHRNRRTGKLDYNPPYARKIYIDSLKNTLQEHVKDNSIIKNPDVYLLKCNAFTSKYLGSYFENSFPNEILSVFTNDDALMILVDSTYTSKSNELSFLDFINQNNLKIVKMRN